MCNDKPLIYTQVLVHFSYKVYLTQDGRSHFHSRKLSMTKREQPRAHQSAKIMLLSVHLLASTYLSDELRNWSSLLPEMQKKTEERYVSTISLKVSAWVVFTCFALFISLNKENFCSHDTFLRLITQLLYLAMIALY